MPLSHRILFTLSLSWERSALEIIWLCRRFVWLYLNEKRKRVTYLSDYTCCTLKAISLHILSCHQTHIVAKEWTEALTGSAWARLSEQSAALAHYTHMITWPFPQWMSLIRSQWRIHWVCNCFPLGEMLTAIELHLTAEFADECSLSTEWSGLIQLWVVMECLKISKLSD